ncbi:SusD/RagB family nutrient-binding outer membrane lipoprotein [Cesiribacter andamanensis]|uniref:Susd and RagB outer membrane lipoprotein n=1 Tax=Cesiribacter andamanensis AMV16 TaxID=1279009 RepID=M7N1J2_9BACT|nr:SusD/RagB family nutrient-binding outer membrane lipoprotein [Cesiribacter andamanensis]EMR02553.1 Susd and RagB outer membrane lipoprotein [Cesiribacter andamanensis AMV16]
MNRMLALQTRFLAVALLSMLLMPTACTDRFEELNVSPTAVQEDRINEDLLFTRSLVYGALRYTEFQRAQQLYANHYIQYYAMSVDRFETDRYITRNDWLTDYWTAAYADFGMQIQQVINISARNENKLNKTAIARIWKVFIMHRITDLWGDVPYFDAFSGIITPRYDRQEDIYLDMLNELKEAEASIDPSRTLNFGSADVLYGGNLTLWRKFANSLRLRLAMRLSEVAPAVAEAHVREVLAAGNLISTNAESALMRYGRDFGNADENIQPMGVIRSFNEYRASSTLVDFLQQNNDPRLEIYLEPANGEFVGLRNGLNPTEINALDPDDYARDSQIISNLFAPSGLLIYPEVLFLQAEAALRGWGPGNAQEYYEQGISASIAYWLDVYQDLQGRIPASELASLPQLDINQEQINTFLAEPGIAYNPSRALEQIITQKWLANINQGFEGYADYRRTGFPRLTPIPNTDGQSETGGSNVPSRLRYPAEEQALNRENYQEAVQRQGPDLPTTRVWWDAD